MYALCLTMSIMSDAHFQQKQIHDKKISEYVHDCHINKKNKQNHITKKHNIVDYVLKIISKIALPLFSYLNRKCQQNVNNNNDVYAKIFSYCKNNNNTNRNADSIIIIIILRYISSTVECILEKEILAIYMTNKYHI